MVIKILWPKKKKLKEEGLISLQFQVTTYQGIVKTGTQRQRDFTHQSKQERLAFLQRGKQGGREEDRQAGHHMNCLLAADWLMLIWL